MVSENVNEVWWHVVLRFFLEKLRNLLRICNHIIPYGIFKDNCVHLCSIHRKKIEITGRVTFFCFLNLRVGAQGA